MRILLDSRKFTVGESLRESLDSFTSLHNVSYSLYENLFGCSQNENGFSDSRWISSPEKHTCTNSHSEILTYFPLGQFSPLHSKPLRTASTEKWLKNEYKYKQKTIGQNSVQKDYSFLNPKIRLSKDKTDLLILSPLKIDPT